MERSNSIGYVIMVILGIVAIVANKQFIQMSHDMQKMMYGEKNSVGRPSMIERALLYLFGIFFIYIGITNLI